MTNKQSLIFTCSYVAITFSLLGWICASVLSPNKHVWIISVPIIFFIAIVQTYLLVEALERNRDVR